MTKERLTELKEGSTYPIDVAVWGAWALQQTDRYPKTRKGSMTDLYVRASERSDWRRSAGIIFG